MATRKATRPQRIDPDFEKDLKEIAKIRLLKGLAKFDRSEISIREITRLMRRAPSYSNLTKELKTLPKRR